MKKTISFFIALMAFCHFIFAQGQLTIPPNGGNKKASSTEQIGLTTVTVNYSRPGVKGREGKIWGTPVAPYGFTDLGFGTSKAAPWRAGANENTTITFSTDVQVEGKNLPAGTYALFVALDAMESTVIFSKNSTSWGSFYYDAAEDALRVTVKNLTNAQSVERLKYEFTDQTDNSATLNLMWENRIISFKVAVDVVGTQLASFKRELRNTPGFSWEGLQYAANYCLKNNVELEQGLKWADESINGQFIGQKNFLTLSTKSGLLAKSGKQTEADALMKEALPLATMQQLHQYGRDLLSQKKTTEALAIFKMNYDKNPNEFTTQVGLMRGLSATGDYKKALDMAKKALTHTPDNNNKSNLEGMIKKLEAGKDVN